MTTKKLYIAAIAFGLLCAACFAAYTLQGSTIYENGILHESFGFIPLGYACGGVAILLAALGFIRK